MTWSISFVDFDKIKMQTNSREYSKRTMFEGKEKDLGQLGALTWSVLLVTGRCPSTASLGIAGSMDIEMECIVLVL